jgi:hypothetical protein
MAKAARRKKTARTARPDERAQQARPGKRPEWPFWGEIGGDAFWGRISGEPGGPFGAPGEKAAAADPASALNQAMLMAAWAPVSALFAANQADALMFYNAVANQQKTNMLSMCVTAKCVKYMFNAGDGDDDDYDEVMEQTLAGQ